MLQGKNGSFHLGIIKPFLEFWFIYFSIFPLISDVFKGFLIKIWQFFSSCTGDVKLPLVPTSYRGMEI